VPGVRGGLWWWRSAFIVLVVSLTYWNSLSGAFILDDQATIVDNHQIREWWRPASVLVPESNTPIAGRPLVNLAFALNYAIGGLSVRGYHLVNIAIHIVCALVVFAVVWRTLEWRRVREHFAGRSADAAFAVALLWAVHPLNTEAVDYLTQRTELMLAMFYLLTLYAAIRAASTPRPAVWESVAVLSCALGMACKESMVTSPLLVVLYDRVYVFDSLKRAFRARGRLYIGLVATWAVLAALNWSAPRAAVGGFSTGVSAWTYLMNQTVMIARYLRLTIWPRSLVVFYGWPLPLTLGDVMPYALLIAFLLLATAVAMKRQPMLGFLGVWFFVTLAPTSSIVPIATEVGAERRMYLPLVAVIALVVAIAYLAGDFLRRRWYGGTEIARPRLAPPGAGLVLIGVAAALAAGTIARNREYRSAETLARTVVERRPTGIAHHVLAEQLVGAGRHEEAMAHLREAVRGGDSRAAYSLGIELFNAGRLQEAIDQLEAFVRTSGLPYHLVPRWLEPPAADVVFARSAMARAFAMQGRLPEAVREAQAALAAAPSNVETRLLLAEALFRQQRYDEAGIQYREYLKSRPDDVKALTDAGITLIATDHLDDAIVLFRHAAEADPRSPNARRILAMALLDRGDFEEAATQAREGIRLNPNDRQLRDLLGQALAKGREGSPLTR
jgi:tetratricopeptide (TPR) repeat protein